MLCITCGESSFDKSRLFSEGDIAEQVEDVTVEVKRFTRGSVVCDFKVTDISPFSPTFTYNSTLTIFFTSR